MACDFSVPNWAQIALAKAAGLNMAAPAIMVDNDHMLCFMDLNDRKEYIVSKKDGHVTRC